MSSEGNDIVCVWCGYENMSRESLICITNNEACRWCKTVIPGDGFFYPHHTPMIDTSTCIPFNLFTTFCFHSRTGYMYKIFLFYFLEFLLKLKKPTLPATGVSFFTLASNLHKLTSFLSPKLGRS